MGNGKSKSLSGPSGNEKIAGSEETKSEVEPISDSANQQAVSPPRETRFLASLEERHYPRRLPPTFYNAIFSLTREAFYLDKPLFAEAEKARAFTALRRYLPVLTAGYDHLCKWIEVKERIDAQISRSGLQFIADEVTEEDDPELHGQLQALINSSCMQGIEGYIKDTIHLPCWREWGPDEEVDPSRIPPSHYWWFYVDSDDEDEE